METSRTCNQCSQPLSADAPDGLCPQCLMKAASGPPPSNSGVGLADDIIDIGDPVEVGRKLPQFEILEMLGRGGMGVVYKARQLQLGRLVALKILPPLDALSADFVARFTREARALAKLNHPNIVNVYDFGETGGLYYIVMEYVEGANLRQLLETRKLTPAEALAIVPKICDALEYAHEEGLVHRDIKPENLLIDKKGRVKIADFGLAKLLRREPLDMTLTLSGMALGTLRYMAPEQMDKPETVDHRADLYSLGVVIYEMLTGETPVGRFELPSEKAGVDVRLDRIVLHALEREPAQRYQHASEVRTDVENVAVGPMAGPVEKSRSKGAGASQVFPIRFWWRDSTDALLTLLGTGWLVCVFWILPTYVIRSLVEAASPLSQSSNFATLGGAFVFLGVMAVFVAGSIQSVRVDAEGLTINRFVGASRYFPWAAALRIEPLSRWEVFRHVFLWPGLPPRGSIMCGTTRHVYRIDCQNDCWYFSPRNLEVFLSAIDRSDLASEIKTGVEKVRGAPQVASTVSPPLFPQITPSAAPILPGEPRLSRCALWGAIWVGLGFLAAIVAGIPLFWMLNRNHAVPAPLAGNVGEAIPLPALVAPGAFIVLILLVLLGASALFGTTILGAIAIGHIKRSGGKLYGLRLAAVDALFFPLLVLGLAVFIVLFLGYRAVTIDWMWIHATSEHPPLSAFARFWNLFIMLDVLVSLAACFFAGRAAWRSIAGKGAESAPEGGEVCGASGDPILNAEKKVQSPADTLLLVAGIALLTAIGIGIWLWGQSALHPGSGLSLGDGRERIVPIKGGQMVISGQQEGVMIVVSAVIIASYAMFIGTAGLLMRRLRGRLFALSCVVLAGLFAPAALAFNCLTEYVPQWAIFTPMWLGMPACLWAVLVLFRDDVREAFVGTPDAHSKDGCEKVADTAFDANRE